MPSLAQKLRDMHALAADACDPEFNRALLDAADEIERLRASLQKIADEPHTWKMRKFANEALTSG